MTLIDLLRDAGEKKIPNVSVYILDTDQYGIEEFSHRLNAYLESQNIASRTIRCKILRLPFNLINDRIDGRVSVTCLRAGVFNFLNPRSIYVLHGFPGLKDYGFLSLFGLVLVYKLSRSFSQYVMSNSEITSAINEKIFNVASDCVWNPLKGHDVNSKNCIKKNTILIPGRVVRAKRVFEILSSLLKCDASKKYQVIVAGPIFDSRVKQLIPTLPGNYIFTGPIGKSEIRKHYSDAAAVITLNDIEPYGLVIDEAAGYNCWILASRFSGAAQGLSDAGYTKIRTVSAFDDEAIFVSIEKFLRELEESEC